MTFTQVETFPGQHLERSFDPTRRYIGLVNGESFDVVDVLEGKPKTSLPRPERIRPGLPGRISPDGVRVLSWDRESLALGDLSIELPGVAHCGFTADGRYVWAAAMEDEPYLALFDLALEELDRTMSLTDLAGEPLESWEESFLDSAEHMPDLVVGACNLGDSLGAVVAFRRKGDRIALAQEPITTAVSVITDERILHVGVLPSRELVLVDGDGLVSVMTFDGDARLERKLYAIEDGQERTGEVLATRDAILIGVARGTNLVSFLDIDPQSLELRGRAPVPGPDVLLIGQGRVATFDGTATTVWKCF